MELRIKLKKLAIKNFKGIDKLEFAFDGNARVKGQNASGKTTLYDAYLWLLYGKDSLDQKDFDIKPIVNGEPMHEAGSQSTSHIGNRRQGSHI